MNHALRLLNRQRRRQLDLPLLRRVVGAFLDECSPSREFDLSIQLVNAAAMTRVNETRLRHAGSTDVITFDFSDDAFPAVTAGELFICVDEAAIQARIFRTTWQSEMVRYIIHGVLHLQGHDDLQAAARKKMKLAEARWVKTLSRDFNLSKLARKPRVTP
jgi:rRNA maturation RNase YbeY